MRKWLDRILDMYPADAKSFLKNRKNGFANPVGSAWAEETENIFSLLLEGQDAAPETISPVLDRLVRITAVQDFSPSQAIIFLYMLKDIITEELEVYIREKDLYDDLLIFFSKIDDMALIAFDIYTKCRETLYEIRVEQAKNRVSGLLRRSGLISEATRSDPSQ